MTEIALHGIVQHKAKRNLMYEYPNSYLILDEGFHMEIFSHVQPLNKHIILPHQTSCL